MKIWVIWERDVTDHLWMIDEICMTEAGAIAIKNERMERCGYTAQYKITEGEVEDANN